MAIQLPWPKWRKKTLFTHFFPTIAEEEEEVNRKPTQELVEIGPALIYDWNNPWKIKKKITHEHLHQRKLVISFSETFEYILPYLKLDKAKQLVNGSVMCVGVWDVTNDTKFYEDSEFTFTKLDNGDYSLSIMTLFNVHGLGIDDEIGLCWNPIVQAFMFKLLSKVWRKKTFSYNFIPSVTRELIETGPAPLIKPNNIMRKKITPESLAFGELRISFFETFEYALPYLKLDYAKQLVDGSVAYAPVWDVTNDAEFYVDAYFRFQKLPNDDYSLSIMRLFNVHGLGVGDEIGLFWNPRFQAFMFKLLSKVCDSRIRPSFVIRGL